MARGIRLPTLYPMPRDRGQYWICYSAASDALDEEVYLARLSERLRREDGTPYAPSMVSKLLSSLDQTGFIQRTDGQVLAPDPVRWIWDGSWDRSDSGFQEYVDATLLKWGRLFPDGLALAYDLLTVLASGPATQTELLDEITRAPGSPGKYDGRDRYGSRTVREVVKLFEFAGWVTRDGRSVNIAKKGEGRRSRHVRKRDTYYQVERILTTVDPVDTRIFSAREKVDLAKHYMYRECGGKYRSEIIRKAHDTIFRFPYQWQLRPEIEEEMEAHKERTQDLRREIGASEPGLASSVKHLRSQNKLRLIRDALTAGDKDRAVALIQQSGGHLSYDGLRDVKHSGPDYTLAPSIRPYDWQCRALDAWRSAGRSGVLQVVTGAGKTVFALLAIEDLLKEVSDLRTSVIVPTKVLMYQWATELVRILGVPPEDIGLRGDGHKDSFGDGKRVMVSIVNSAVQDDYLRRDVEALRGNLAHLLIADECHRYQGAHFSKVFEVPFAYGLGLSATAVDPASSSSEGALQATPLKELGGIFFDYTYQEALADGVVQDFTVRYVGVDLTAGERRIYDAYTKQIRKTLERIRGRYGPRLEAMNGPLFAKLHTILNGDENPDPAISRYFTAVRERKDLVFSAVNRKWAYLDIIHGRTVDRPEDRSEDKIIVFHERIENLEDIVAPTDQRRVLVGEEDVGALRGLSSVTDENQGTPAKYRLDPVEKHVDHNLEDLFFKASFRPVMYHSGHSSPAWNEIGMEWFRAGVTNVMLSVKALVEGVDVPAANVGIIRASSSSVRQRIQTTGRILRRAAGKDRPALLYVIYVRDTTDERIFRGMDWASHLGESAVQSFRWHAPEDPTSVRGRLEDLGSQLPQVPDLWDDDEDYEEVDPSELEIGDPYPGRYAGREFHVDAEGRPFRKSRSGRRFIQNPEVKDAAKRILHWKRGGKFVVTPEGHMITKLEDRGLVFLGVVDGAVEVDIDDSEGSGPLGGEPATFDDLFGT